MLATRGDCPAAPYCMRARRGRGEGVSLLGQLGHVRIALAQQVINPAADSRGSASMDAGASGGDVGAPRCSAGRSLGARHPVIHPAEIRAFQAVNGLPGLALPGALAADAAGQPGGRHRPSAWWSPGRSGRGRSPSAWCWRWAQAGRPSASSASRWRSTCESASARAPASPHADAARRRARPRPELPVGPRDPGGRGGTRADVGPERAGGLDPVRAGGRSSPLGRVYVGAHNPLDVTAGLGTGLLIGGLLHLVLIPLTS